MTGKEFFEQVQKRQKEKNQSVFLAACQLFNLVTEIRNYTHTRIYGSFEKQTEAVEKLPYLIFEKLPRLVLELQDTFKPKAEKEQDE